MNWNTKALYQAFKKYGIEHFSFEIIEECLPEELDSREAYWIETLDTISPKGYNVAEISEGSLSNYCFLNKEIVDNIIFDLKNNVFYSLSDLANKYKVNVSTISRINSGKTHYRKEEKYPLCYIEANIHRCCDCGIKISTYATRCLSCEAKHKQTFSISRKELKDLIRTLPFTKIGELYNVSDNAIRKWCIKYSLPSKKSEIKKISDEEWQNV